VRTKTIIHTKKAPAAIGPYSQAVKAKGPFVFVSGQLGLDPATGEFTSTTDVAAQTEQVLKNLEAILKASNSSCDKVVKTTCLLADMNDFKKFNDVYAKYFPKECPARATFAVKTLPKNALVEVEAIAVADE